METGYWQLATGNVSFFRIVTADRIRLYPDSPRLDCLALRGRRPVPARIEKRDLNHRSVAPYLGHGRSGQYRVARAAGLT
jgi:hypothetical protein